VIQADHEQCDGNRGCNDSCQVACEGNCPDIEWILIEQGSFTMGDTRGACLPQSKPKVDVNIEYDYYISKKEITVGQYRTCVDAGVCAQPQGGLECTWNMSNPNDLPLNCVSWTEVKTFASWIGADLPSETEWEFASRGVNNRTYPWANSPRATCSYSHMKSSSNRDGCGINQNEPPATGCSYTRGNTPDGVCDMAGNLSEWTLDTYYGNHNDALVDGSARCSTENCDDGLNHTIKGGDLTSINVLQTGACRSGKDSTVGHSTVGARLVLAP
jgi:formylglycine-generating enzyme required for sulfatase activity